MPEAARSRLGTYAGCSRRWPAKRGSSAAFTAHGLRHTHAAELRGEGVDIGVISKELGHRSLLTTIRYLDHIAPTAVIAAIGKREWGGA